ncbi:MAG TPA: HD domain-containing protein [Candidatus Faecimonas gallistercoris]|mgnify:CR=1 FL=1|nr:HD domain-containing protein [Candidatus Faecimonas gallistercoris]
MNNYVDEEFENIVAPILELEEFNRLKFITHHGITRYDHSMRVAYLSYKVSKSLRLDYKEVTEAALLHDFFLDEVNHESRIERLRHHPECAVKNASKYFDLSDRQKDIIRTHMFPVTFTPPKYIESWIVDLVDDIAAVYEGCYRMHLELRTAMFMFMFFVVNFVKMR